MFLEKLKYPYFACLSILAIWGLAFFPLEGFCGWTYMDEGYSSFSDSYTEGHGGGWSLSGSVMADSSNASASVSPSIDNPTAFDGANKTRVANYSGGATIETSREECTLWISSGYMGSLDSYAREVTYPAVTDPGNGSYLQAWVLMVEEESKKVYATLVSNSTITLTINVNLGDERAETGATWKSGGKTYKTSYSTKITRVIPQAQPSASLSASVSGREEASKSAWVAYLSFGGNSYSSADASYTTYDE